MNTEILSSLKKELLELTDKASKIRELLKLYGESDSNGYSPIVGQFDISVQPSQPSIKDTTQNGKRKIVPSDVVFLISKTGHLMKVGAIIQGLLPNDADYRLKMSTVLGNLRNQKKLNSYKEGNRNKDTYWGLPEWFNENGTPKEEFTKTKKALESA